MHSRPVRSLTLICFCINVGECRGTGIGDGGGGAFTSSSLLPIPVMSGLRQTAELTHNQRKLGPLELCSD